MGSNSHNCRYVLRYRRPIRANIFSAWPAHQLRKQPNMFGSPLRSLFSLFHTYPSHGTARRAEGTIFLKFKTRVSYGALQGPEEPQKSKERWTRWTSALPLVNLLLIGTIARYRKYLLRGIDNMYRLCIYRMEKYPTVGTAVVGLTNNLPV